MLTIRATDDEIEISGKLDELNAAEKKISEFSQNDNLHEIRIEASAEASAYPYDVVLSAMIVEKDSGPINVQVNAGELVVAASSNNVEVFSSYFEFNGEESMGSHNHLEYYDGDVYIHPKSRSLVVALSK